MVNAWRKLCSKSPSAPGTASCKHVLIIALDWKQNWWEGSQQATMCQKKYEITTVNYNLMKKPALPQTRNIAITIVYPTVIEARLINLQTTSQLQHHSQNTLFRIRCQRDDSQSFWYSQWFMFSVNAFSIICLFNEKGITGITILLEAPNSGWYNLEQKSCLRWIISKTTHVTVHQYIIISDSTVAMSVYRMRSWYINPYQETIGLGEDCCHCFKDCCHCFIE